MSTYINPGPAVTVGSTQAFSGSDTILGAITGTVGFYGSIGVTKQTVAADATDLPTAVALANSLKAALVAVGLVA